MKLKTLLSYLLENVDEGAIRGFSLDILKKKMPEFKGQWYPEDIGIKIIELVESYNLPYLGEGSSRTVYVLGAGKVLKIATNQKGIAQNEAEFEVSRDPSTKYIGARVYEKDPDFHWSVMEVAKIYEDSTQLKLDLGIPPVIAERYGYQITRVLDAIRDVTDRRRGSPVDEVIEDAVHSFDDEEEREQYRKFLEDPPYGLLALVDLTDKEERGDHALEYGDIVPDHFGKTASGRPVLIDYGFTTGVRSEHYEEGNYSYYSQGSPPPSSIMSRDEEEDIEIPRESERRSERSDWGPLGPPSNRDEGDALDRERMRQMRRQRGVSGEQV